MHPFGGTPICPRCSKAVYAAEQIMGPGRKLYHKPCLTCTTCGKRLDSYNLVEHDQEPYCKTCHVKNFGTRDLRHANLPDRDDLLLSPPTSPIRNRVILPPSSGVPPASPTRIDPTYARTGSPTPIFRPTRALSPGRGSNVENAAFSSVDDPVNGATFASKDNDEWAPPIIHNQNTTPSHLGRGTGGLPRTVPLDFTMTGPPRAESPVKESSNFARAESPTKEPSTPTRVVPTSTGNGATVQGHTVLSGRMSIPLTPKGTGTRYGMALDGRTASPMSPTRQWGGGSTPLCAKCGKSVYFAEQVKAIGKTFHRNCLRCSECNKQLDSTRLTENEGNPYCTHCYGKLYGPAGSGYALLGKAGAG